MVRVCTSCYLHQLGVVARVSATNHFPSSARPMEVLQELSKLAEIYSRPGIHYSQCLLLSSCIMHYPIFACAFFTCFIIFTCITLYCMKCHKVTAQLIITIRFNTYMYYKKCLLYVSTRTQIPHLFCLTTRIAIYLPDISQLLYLQQYLHILCTRLSFSLWPTLYFQLMYMVYIYTMKRAIFVGVHNIHVHRYTPTGTCMYMQV